ncbi:MAG TPA: aminotransferase class I/II-fold pyridoxal phosphate-dependent enzyme [Solirubrobacteraceae bacterium]|jgi:histidinol-phosphate aminotransferase|nr:aminotransferase class I/II-fold pyridoxal phosphate-dependent enzyme [Solirubrobacteraceae bacterium]
MGLLDYYRQFDGVPEEEINRELREEAAERRRKALTRVQTIDLSQTTWPELPHPNIANSITFIARRGLQLYPHLRGSELRNELADRHGVDPARLIVGNGAAELLSAATRALIEPGQKLITTWPSYPLFPLMARRAHGQAVPVSGGVDALLAAVAEHDTRVVAVASPNDPTGELLGVAELERLLVGLPDGVAMLLDEALIEFADTQPVDASLALLEEHPRLLVFRSFSKAWGMAGLRVGYAIGGPGSQELLAELEPDLGVNELSQAGALEALRTAGELLDKHVHAVAVERIRLSTALCKRGFEVSDSQANFLWAAHPTLDGGELAARLSRAGVLVAAGGGLGEPRHVRISLRNPVASDRLLAAIDSTLAQPEDGAQPEPEGNAQPEPQSEPESAPEAA